ncbi:hypothetical protein J7643_10720 [bacterium]|nr:hypothetical protein [bacterium]
MSSSNSVSQRTVPPSVGSTTSTRPAPPAANDARPLPPSSKDSYKSDANRPSPPSTGSSGRPTPPAANDGDYRPTPPSTGGSSRPTPPSTGGSSRPTPPSTGGSTRPTPPSGRDDGYSDRPTPPPVHEPRYYWQPTFPVILPSDPKPVPKIALPPAPVPARKVDLSEVSNDPVDLLAGYGRLREEKKRLVGKTYPKLDAGEAKLALSSGKTIFLAKDDGAHPFSKDAYKPVKSEDELKPLLPSVRAQKQQDMQTSENRAYQGRVDAWVNEDVNRRINNLPAFNSVYDTNRLSLTNYMVTEGGRSFNRNLITAMNIYNQPGTKREIAEKWHDSPEMSTAEFNRMANSVVTQKIARLGWNAEYMGDYGSYLGTNPVPGLRYPDTQEDVDYNVDAIRRVSQQLPFLLNDAVNTR